MKSMSAAEQLDQELAGLRLSEARKTAILETLKGEKPVSKKRRVVNTILIAAALCALCAFSALALSPTLRDRLAQAWGGFLPYSQTIEGVTCADRGIEIEVLSALSDDVRAQVYFAVRDVEEDRLDEWLELSGTLTAGEEAEENEAAATPPIGEFSTSAFPLVSYDPETRTALFSASIWYGDGAQPNREASLTITGMSTTTGGAGYTGKESRDGTADCGAVTGQTLDSLPLGEGDQVLQPNSYLYPQELLPDVEVVLAPGQNPVPVQGTEDLWVSSMGFASDGCFHVRLELAEGNEIVVDGYYKEGSILSNIMPVGEVEDDTKYIVTQPVLVEGGLDIRYPLITAEDLNELSYVIFFGSYTRPGVELEGDWSMDFQMDYYPSVTLDWTGELDGRQIHQVTVSPMTVTMYSEDWGSYASETLYAVKKDGSTVAAEPGASLFVNVNVGAGAGEEIFNAYLTWEFDEPVELEDIVSLTLAGERIPVSE